MPKDNDLTPEFPLLTHDEEVTIPTGFSDVPGQTVGGWSANSQSLTAGNVKLESNTERLLMGLATAPLAGLGIFLGKDGNDYEFRAGDPTGQYIHWDGTNLSITGTLTASTLKYGKTAFTDTISAGYHISSLGVYIGAALDATYLKYTVADGSFTIKGGVITSIGSSIGSSYLSGIVPQGNLNVANRGWSQTCVFSITNATTVAWGTGTFTSADGTAYSISAGNTGSMAAKTYIYLDTGVSTTVFQTTTGAAGSVGAAKVLIAIAQNGAVEPTYRVMSGQGGENIDAANIVSGSITANEIAASTITAGLLSVSQLSAITADLGTITAGTVTLSAAGHIKAGQTDYNTGTGFWLGISSAVAKFSLGNPAGRYLTWDGSDLTINGYVQSSKGAFGGDGSDGALSITSGTTNFDLGGAEYYVKNYSSISITGGNITFTNPHTNGTKVLFKSSGAVTFTSTVAAIIDVSNLGANAATNGSFMLMRTNKGVDGPTATGGTISTYFFNAVQSFMFSHFTMAFVGAGGGNGYKPYGDSGDPGVGGRGGGCLILECAGALNFPSGVTILAKGQDGGAPGAPGAGGNGSPGGGGGGGFVGLFYNSVTSVAGTITKTGGAGYSGGSGAGGGGGGSAFNAGTNGGTSQGGNGGDGYSLVEQNTAYA